MDYRNAPAKKGTAIECDTDPYDSLATTGTEKEYSTVSYDNEDETVDSKKVDITLKTKYVRKDQSNIETRDNTASSNNSTSITNVSKSSPIVVIIAMVVFMVVITIASSIVTATILTQKFEKDLKSIKDEITSYHLVNNITDKESVWSTWSDWGECSGTCNGGLRTRNRACATSGMDGSRGTCIGNDVDISSCNNDLCAESIWSTWYEWGECSVTCDVGIRTRNRTCASSEADISRGICIGNGVDISTCNNKLCAESVWSTWSGWGECSATCNGGIRTRNRTCYTSDMNGSRGICTGADFDVSTCKHGFCTENLFELLQLSKFLGSTYVRWGRTTCPGNGTELVYVGYAGGSWFDHSGGAADYLCLPRDPDWGHYEDSIQTGGLVYGAEYEYSARASSAAFFTSQTSNLRDNEVPCAVCRSTRSSVLMVPAKNQCHAGWTHEYHGYLSSGSNAHPAASEYVCVDSAAELLDGGKTTNDNGKLFYFVEGHCGSLKCPPYVNGRELTCVVCTK